MVSNNNSLSLTKQNSKLKTDLNLVTIHSLHLLYTHSLPTRSSTTEITQHIHTYNIYTCNTHTYQGVIIELLLALAHTYNTYIHTNIDSCQNLPELTLSQMELTYVISSLSFCYDLVLSNKPHWLIKVNVLSDGFLHESEIWLVLSHSAESLVSSNNPKTILIILEQPLYF